MTLYNNYNPMNISKFLMPVESVCSKPPSYRAAHYQQNYNPMNMSFNRG